MKCKKHNIEMEHYFKADYDLQKIVGEYYCIDCLNEEIEAL
jgi:hypothetical protein